MQNGWHTMGEGHLFLLDQSQQRIWQVATWVDLLDAHRCCQVGHPPCVNVEHWSNGHIDIATMEALVLRSTCQRPKHGKGVQHELTMAEIDSLRIAGGAGCIEGRGASVFIKVRKIEVLSTPGQQVFILCRERHKRPRVLGSTDSIA